MLATSDPALAFSGIPTIPVRVWGEEGQWRKQPLAEWDRATIDEDQITAWRRKWLDARPGVPLAAVGWCVVDVDDPECAAFWEVWDGLGPRGPYSKVRTISGGWHFVFAQPPQPISRIKWCEGVEVLGTASVLTVSRRRGDLVSEGGSEGGVAESVLGAVGPARSVPH